MIFMGYKVRVTSFVLGSNGGRPREAQNCLVRSQNYLTKAKQTKLEVPVNANDYLTANLPEHLR